MNKFKMGQKLIHTIKELYANATSAVLIQDTVGERFRTSVGVQQGCLLSPTLFNIFLERITTDAMKDLSGTVSIGGRTITNLKFADDIDGLAEKEELASLVKQLDEASSRYSMEISAEKTKLMTNSVQPITTKITEHVTNTEIRIRVTQQVRHHEDLLATVKKRKLRWYGHVTRSEGLTKTILERTVQGKRRRDRQKKNWADNISEWKGKALLTLKQSPTTALDGASWYIVHPSCSAPTTRAGYGTSNCNSHSGMNREMPVF
ncbi:hypothetical protein RRG08_018076 [Elysia crispata]|uniref:Reverse transcriptase domain-containing protein n=1 Tax=Elysia crispata TaxID=231223 RepID=A0AAE1DE44_9GAST|nr:hypothetical protein RRG08_018076 [Elysia crispata]